MYLRYNGKTKGFTFRGVDFSSGPAKVDDSIGKQWLAENPKTFTEVIPVSEVQAKPVIVADDVDESASTERIARATTKPKPKVKKS